MQTDEIALNIEALKVKTCIGVYTWEQRLQQTLLIDIHCPLLHHYPKDLGETVDYETLCRKVATFLNQGTFTLIEEVASQIADFILNEFPVSSVSIVVNKPYAVPNARAVRVKVVRYRKVE